MNQLSFEWNDSKAEANKRKHGISFTEAQSVFYDPNALLIGDPDHSLSEERFVIIGLSYNLRIVIVCHCYRKNGSSIRIISARKATKHEQKEYKERIS